ncbi:S1C family serine protease [Nonomuraea sp. NPDC003214]
MQRILPALTALTLVAGCGQIPPPGAQSPGTPAPPSATHTDTASHPPPASPTSHAQSLETAYERVIAEVLPSIVQINTSTGLGSGVVYDAEGHIVTNAHVVGDAKQMDVTLATGGATRRARLVKAFPAGDLAVIKVDDPQGLQPARFGDSAKLRVGQLVLAMGNPLGLSGSVTNGIVSALGRTVSEPENPGSPGATIAGAVQTSAAINPGNSGGALVDLSGQVIGIPTLAATDPSLGGGAAPGIGFAIPSNTATDIAAQIIKHGKVINSHRAALGVRGSTVIGENGRPAGVGVVSLVRNSGAEKAGIQEGDVITGVNDTETPTMAALTEALTTYKPGDKVRIELTRGGGAPQTVTVTLGELAAD